MDNKTLALLPKQDLISIIMSDYQWKRKAFIKVSKLVSDKISAILDKQEQCDLSTIDGRVRYMELEKEYKKWQKIQMRLTLEK